MSNLDYTTHTAVEFSEHEKLLFREDFDQGSWVSRHYPKGHTVLSFDTNRYPLAQELTKIIIDKGLASEQGLAEVGGLEYLHKLVPEDMQNLDADEVNETTRRLYDQNAEFGLIYRAFIKEFCQSVVGEPCVFQNNPTIRVHFPNQKGFNWAPRHHTDIMIGHPPQEVNLWIPLTKVYESNSLCVSDLSDSLDILYGLNVDLGGFAHKVQTDSALQTRLKNQSQSLNLKYGEYSIFDSRCIHACQYNVTDTTRISIDVRVIPVSDYNTIRADYHGTGRRKMHFAKGAFYDQLTSEEI